MQFDNLTTKTMKHGNLSLKLEFIV